MKNRPLPSARELGEWLSYDPATGVLTWLKGVRRGKCFVGREAGNVSKTDGYRRLKLGGRRLLAHRVIWRLVHDQDPAVDVDHRDGDRSNNRLTNLRLADKAENGRNKRAQGRWPKGVYQRRDGRFVAQLKILGRVRFLGAHDTSDEAHAAYATRAKAEFGAFACPTGRRDGVFA